jgi:hypothetical protein
MSRRDFARLQSERKAYGEALAKYRSEATLFQEAVKESEHCVATAKRIVSSNSDPIVEVMTRSVGKEDMVVTCNHISTDIAALRRRKTKLLELEVQKRSHLLALEVHKRQLHLRGCQSPSDVQQRMNGIELCMSTQTIGSSGEWYYLQELRDLRSFLKDLISIDHIVKPIESQILAHGARKVQPPWARFDRDFDDDFDDMYVSGRFGLRLWKSDDKETRAWVVALGLKDEELKMRLKVLAKSSLLLHTLSGKIPSGCAVLIRTFCAPLFESSSNEDYTCNYIASKDVNAWLVIAEVL